jgi:uncharacterized damage-inducible protein DinB
VTPELILFLFQYNQWANRRTLDACSALTTEQFTRNLGSSFGSVRDTIAHIYGAEWVWNERFLGRSPSGLPGPSAYPDLSAMSEKLDEMDTYYVDFISRLAAADLERVIRYKNLAGDELANPLWQSLHQVSNHGTYHRGQITTLLRQLGVKAISTDLIAFYREKAAAGA